MKDTPLGLPDGSIRAILIILVVIGAMIGIFFVRNPDVNNKFFDILKMLIPLYIGGRMSWNKKEIKE